MDQTVIAVQPTEAIDFTKSLTSKEVERIISAFGFNAHECFVPENSKVADFFAMLPGMDDEDKAEVSNRFSAAKAELGLDLQPQELVKEVARQLRARQN